MSEQKSLRLKVGKEVLLGKLSLAEAMERCGIKDKRTMIRWAQRAMRNSSTDQDFDSLASLSDTEEVYLEEEYHSAHHSLEEEVRRKETEIKLLKEKNLALLRYQKVLSNRINDLEIMINFAERTHHIHIMKLNLKKK